MYVFILCILLSIFFYVYIRAKIPYIFPKEMRKAQCYSFAAGFAALMNFPLWKAQAIGQAGFELPTKERGFWHRYKLAVQPPYKGIIAAWLGK